MYPYRFKTEQEMIDTLGENWRYKGFGDIGWNEEGGMDFLLGKDFPFTEEQLNFNDDEPINNRYGSWVIHWDMLIKNKANIPSYKPKKIDRILESNNLNMDYYNPITKQFTKWEYRFKTEDEFNREFNYSSGGRCWHIPDYIFLHDMKYLLGQTLEYDFPSDYFSIEIPRRENTNYTWYISKYMITNNDKGKPSYKPRKIDRTLESTENEWYPYRFKTEEEFIKEFGEDWRQDRENIGPNWTSYGAMDHLFGKDFPFNKSEVNLKDEKYPLDNRWDDPNSRYSWTIGWYMLTPNKPIASMMYKPKKIDRTLESINLLLEKSSLTQLGVPREVMQPIQKDFAIPADAEWDRIKLKRDVQNILRKGNKDMILQITVDSIKLFVSYPKGTEIIYFIDNYVYNDTGWGGEFEKLEREYTTMTQLFYQIDSSTLLYHLKSDFSLIKQSKRKLIKKEKRFQDFTEKFKKDFLTNFDSILKRIVGSKYMDAKKDIDVKAKQIEIENQMMISGLNEPLSGPNSLSILDEFLMSFEDAYSEYFGERLDIEELSSYFSREKIMTAFMYYIYMNRIMK